MRNHLLEEICNLCGHLLRLFGEEEPAVNEAFIKHPDNIDPLFVGEMEEDILAADQ